MALIVNDKCTGCAACYNICPVTAISIDADSMGFFRAKRDSNICINCGKCDDVCNRRNTIHFIKPSNPFVYAAWSKNTDACKSSNSGAMFYEFATQVIKNEGVVFGAAFDKNLDLQHTYAETLIDVKKLMHSKFVQSYIGDTLIRVKKFLDEDRLVLFVGAPCQIKGLYAYLQQDYENLITAQFPCFGLPPQRFFKDYIKYFTNNNIENISSVLFEVQMDEDVNKRFFVCKMKDGSLISERAVTNKYIKAWNKKLCIDNHCFECKDNLLPFSADIVWGNYWHIGEIESFPVNKIEYENGISMLILNTDKALTLFEQVKPNINYYKRTLKEAITYHYQFQATLATHICTKKQYKSSERLEFMSDYQRLTFVELMNKYFPNKEEMLISVRLASLLSSKITARIWRLIYYLQMVQNKL